MAMQLQSWLPRVHTSLATAARCVCCSAMAAVAMLVFLVAAWDRPPHSLCLLAPMYALGRRAWIVARGWLGDNCWAPSMSSAGADCVATSSSVSPCPATPTHTVCCQEVAASGTVPPSIWSAISAAALPARSPAQSSSVACQALWTLATRVCPATVPHTMCQCVAAMAIPSPLLAWPSAWDCRKPTMSMVHAMLAMPVKWEHMIVQRERSAWKGARYACPACRDRVISTFAVRKTEI